MSIKQESLEQGVWPGPTGSPHSSSDVASRTKRVGSSTGGKHCITALKNCVTLSKTTAESRTQQVIVLIKLDRFGPYSTQ